MSIDTDQATLDRWLAAGTWGQFAPGEVRVSTQRMTPDSNLPGTYLVPPADWEADQKCETCQGTRQGRLIVDFGNGGPIPKCRSCNGTGLRRHPVTVLCPFPATESDPHGGETRHGVPRKCDTNGRITVAWATVEWGPLPVVAQHDPEPPAPYVVVLPIGVWLVEATDTERLTLPPGIDPQSLVGQRARGGKIEVTP